MKIGIMNDYELKCRVNFVNNLTISNVFIGYRDKDIYAKIGNDGNIYIGKDKEDACMLDPIKINGYLISESFVTKSNTAYIYLDNEGFSKVKERLMLLRENE